MSYIVVNPQLIINKMEGTGLRPNYCTSPHLQTQQEPHQEKLLSVCVNPDCSRLQGLRLNSVKNRLVHSWFNSLDFFIHKSCGAS